MNNTTYKELAEYVALHYALHGTVLNVAELSERYKNANPEAAALIKDGADCLRKAYKLTIPNEPSAKNESRPCIGCHHCVSTFPIEDKWAHDRGRPTTGCLECEAGERMSLREPCPKFEQRKGKHRIIYTGK